MLLLLIMRAITGAEWAELAVCGDGRPAHEHLRSGPCTPALPCRSTGALCHYLLQGIILCCITWLLASYMLVSRRSGPTGREPPVLQDLIILPEHVSSLAEILVLAGFAILPAPAVSPSMIE